MNNERIRDRVWIWGHPPKSLINEFNIEGKLTPIEGMKYFGARNVYYVPCHTSVNMDSCNKEMAECRKFGWSVEYPERIDLIINQSFQYENLRHVVLDDFFCPGTKNSFEHYSPESLKLIKEKLHTKGAHPLEMWVVYYTMNESDNAWALNRIFDGVALWFWHEVTNEEFERKCDEYFRATKGQKHMIGCYLYDFGNKREISPDSVRYQLDRNREFLKKGLIDGFILHTNAVVGLNFEAVEVAKKWMEEHGDELI